MEYIKLNLQNGEKFDANHLNHLEEGILNGAHEMDKQLAWIQILQGDVSTLSNTISSMQTRIGEMSTSVSLMGEIVEQLCMTVVPIPANEFEYMFATNYSESISSTDANFFAGLLVTCLPLKVALESEDYYDFLSFAPQCLEYVPVETENGTMNMLKGTFVCEVEGLILSVVLEKHLSEDYTLTAHMEVKGTSGNTSVDINMVEYTSLFALGNTLTAEDIGTSIFDRLNIAIANNVPFYVNKWKTISDTEKYMEPYKFELYRTTYNVETNEPIRYVFICSQMGLSEGKITLAGLTLTYDVINQTITGNQVLSE